MRAFVAQVEDNEDGIDCNLHTTSETSSSMAYHKIHVQPLPKSSRNISRNSHTWQPLSMTALQVTMTILLTYQYCYSVTMTESRYHNNLVTMTTLLPSQPCYHYNLVTNLGRGTAIGGLGSHNSHRLDSRSANSHRLDSRSAKSN